MVVELRLNMLQVTPFWFALGVLFKYRTMSNYRNPEFLGPRIGDKLIFSLLIMSVSSCATLHDAVSFLPS